jgi:hypothetical protein
MRTLMSNIIIPELLVSSKKKLINPASIAFGQLKIAKLCQTRQQAAADGHPLDVKTIMDPWLNQIGFPFITVTRKEDGTATVKQEQFFYPPNQAISVESPWKYV